MGLADDLKRKAGSSLPGKPKAAGPLWKGPEVDGITFSMLSRFLGCRERFRVYAIEGLRQAPDFNHRIEYGQMWHACEEAHAANEDVTDSLLQYAQTLAAKYPLRQEQVDHWYNVCRVQFPEYVKYWARHHHAGRTPVEQEKTFDVPYTLPSGRTVRLRGKRDSVDLVEHKGRKELWLQENKTKSEIDPDGLRRQLTFDLQTMMYLTVMTQDNGDTPLERAKEAGAVVTGVRYNVVRRPLSGGKGTIVRHKPTKSNPQGESKADYYNRLRGIIAEAPGEYFARWEVAVSPGDIKEFRRKCLDPVLEQLCDWWDWIVTLGNEPFDTKGSGGIHWQFPFGVYNPLLEGGGSDLDEYLMTGSTVGLVKVSRLFEELGDDSVRPEV